MAAAQMSQADYYKAIERWALQQGSTIGSQLAEGTYPSTVQRPEYIPELLFQNPTIQKKFANMKSNERVPESNKQRIPGEYPYYRPQKMMEYMQSLATKLPERSYSIYIGPGQPNVVFFVSEPQFKIEKNKFKIHLMFNVKYMKQVLPKLFNELLGKGFPVVFKLLNFNPVTSIINRAGNPNPIFDGLKDHHYDYGVNRAKKAEYGRLAESFIYSPTEIKKYQVAAHFTDPFGESKKWPASQTTGKFLLDGTTKKGKVIKEQYDMETLFDPVIVFYTNDDDPHYTHKLLQELLTIFPDEITREWVLPNFYPRANVKINNMIYLANGDFGTKYNKRLQCKFNYSAPGPICVLPPNDPILDIPPEYEEIQSSCSKKAAEDECNAANRFPLAVSNNKLCKWEQDGNDKGKCTPHKTYSQHLLLQDYASLHDLYDAMGQRAVLEGFKAGNANGSLPGNYGGRRTKRNKRKNKNKSRRAH